MKNSHVLLISFFCSFSFFNINSMESQALSKRVQALLPLIKKGDAHGFRNHYEWSENIIPDLFSDHQQDQTQALADCNALLDSTNIALIRSQRRYKRARCMRYYNLFAPLVWGLLVVYNGATDLTIDLFTAAFCWKAGQNEPRYKQLVQTTSGQLEQTRSIAQEISSIAAASQDPEQRKQVHLTHCERVKDLAQQKLKLLEALQNQKEELEKMVDWSSQEIAEYESEAKEA